MGALESDRDCNGVVVSYRFCFLFDDKVRLAGPWPGAPLLRFDFSIELENNGEPEGEDDAEWDAALAVSSRRRGVVVDDADLFPLTVPLLELVVELALALAVALVVRLVSLVSE